jgi:hypothetical protein
MSNTMLSIPHMPMSSAPKSTPRIIMSARRSAAWSAFYGPGTYHDPILLLVVHDA